MSDRLRPKRCWLLLSSTCRWESLATPSIFWKSARLGPVFSRRPLAFRALHEQATVGRNKTTSTFGRAFSGGPRKQEGARASPPPIGHGVSPQVQAYVVPLASISDGNLNLVGVAFGLWSTYRKAIAVARYLGPQPTLSHFVDPSFCGCACLRVSYFELVVAAVVHQQRVELGVPCLLLDQQRIDAIAKRRASNVCGERRLFRPSVAIARLTIRSQQSDVRS
ncbi:hypothetical protein ACVWXM_006776 [Bradyrhizobium sp. GM7.3]